MQNHSYLCIIPRKKEQPHGEVQLLSGSKYGVLLDVLAKTHKDCGNFRTGCVVLRIELAVRAVYDTCAARPLHCRNSVLGNGRGVGVSPSIY